MRCAHVTLLFILAGCHGVSDRPWTAMQTELQASPDRSVGIYVGAGMAGRNNPQNPTGDEDNLTVAAGARIPWKQASFRPEIHAGDRTWQFTPSITYDFAIAGRGLGSIDGHVGLGYSINSNDENSVLGDSDSLFLRVGAEAYLVGDVLVGASLLVAPWGYNRDDTAVAGVVYFGIRL